MALHRLIGQRRHEPRPRSANRRGSPENLPEPPAARHNRCASGGAHQSPAMHKVKLSRGTPEQSRPGNKSRPAGLPCPVLQQ